MRRVTAIVVAALVGVVAVAAGALARERPAEMEQMAAASGALALSNSASGAAIITAHGLMPGEATTGEITLGNTGEAAGLLVLARTAITDTPGPYGGRLSDALTLVIEDVTAPADAARGLLRRGRRARAGGARRARRRRRADLPLHRRVPRHRAGRCRQRLHRLGGPLRLRVARGGPPAPARGDADAGPGAPAPPGGGGGEPPTGPSGETPNDPSKAPIIYLKIPRQRVMHTDAVRLYARCSSRCRVKFSGRAETAPRAKRATRRPLLRRGLFRGEQTKRRVGVKRQKLLKLKLTRRGRSTLRRQLDSKARVGVVIRARVKGRYGTRTVKRRIVLHTTLDPGREADLGPLSRQGVRPSFLEPGSRRNGV